MDEQISSLAQLQANLTVVLTSWPLYRTFVYYGRGGHPEHPTGVNRPRFSQVPKQLRLHCNEEKCKQETWWETQEGPFFFNRFIEDARYVCRNCGNASIQYYFIWQEHDNRNIFLKIGQYPELEERIPETLLKSLSQVDVKLYKNAIRMRNFNFGLAAVAYMRRIVENKMNDMLEILHEVAVSHNAIEEVLKKHDEIRKEKRFAQKVEYAGELLPGNLRPPGKPNPMAILHELTSEGIHAKSDEECVEIFDRCRAIFEFVFGKMKIEVEDAKKFVTLMADLASQPQQRHPFKKT